jgi:hypothetical protein
MGYQMATPWLQGRLRVNVGRNHAQHSSLHHGCRMRYR